LEGLGTTTTSASNIPWLVTLGATRCSYIFFENEALSESYVSEKLHLYTGAKEVANIIKETLTTSKQ